jgi:hypothetical protein
VNQNLNQISKLRTPEISNTRAKSIKFGSSNFEICFKFSESLHRPHWSQLHLGERISAHSGALPSLSRNLSKDPGSELLGLPLQVRTGVRDTVGVVGWGVLGILGILGILGGCWFWCEIVM